MTHPSRRKGEEVWKEIEGFPLYEVSSKGRVRSWKNNRHGKAESPKILKQSESGRGYLCVGLRNPDMDNASWEKVHHLVAEAFIDEDRNGRSILHKNDVKEDNRSENLYYGTPQDNADDKNKNGKQPRGEDFERGLTEENVRFIREKRGEITQQRLAKMFDIAQPTVSEVQLYKIWNHID